MNKKRMRRRHDGKRTYPTLRAAQRAAAEMAQRKARQGNPIVTFLRAYGCHCGRFHVGNSRDIDWALVSKLSAAPRAG